jgi:adenylate kinase
VIFVLLGAPGAGKGTQAEALAAATGAAHVATGDLFRAEIAAGTPLGVAAKEYIDAGKLVPDAVTINMIRARLAKPDAAMAVILDGFPRTAAQATALDEVFGSTGRTILAVLLNVDRADLAARITGRRICPTCAKSYHVINNPPQREGHCDTCNSPLITRSDDAPDTVAARLANQLEALEAVTEYYRGEGRLQVVDGSGPIASVQQRLADAASTIGLAQ